MVSITARPARQAPVDQVAGQFDLDGDRRHAVTFLRVPHDSQLGVAQVEIVAGAHATA
jgi:hypothetical protein